MEEVNKTLARFMARLLTLDVLFVIEDSLYVMKRQDHW